MTWKRQDQMTVKERKEMKQKFLESLLNDPDNKWEYVIIDGEKTEYMISNNGQLASLRMCRMMKPSAGSDGYIATIIRHNGKKINVAIHRLVAIAFIPNPNNLPQVNHKNGNKNINCDWNLEWVTQHDNIIHAIETGLRDNYLPEKRYSNKDIHKVCKLLEKGLSNKDISKKTGVSKRVIRSIKRGKAWKHISIQYNIIELYQSTRTDQTLKEQASTTIESDSYDIEEEVYYKWEREYSTAQANGVSI